MKKTVTYNGKKYYMKELAEIAGISLECFRSRVYKYAWTIEEVMNGKKDNVENASSVKILPKGRKLKSFATCAYRCAAK